MSEPKPLTPGTPRETAIPQLLKTEGAKLLSLAGRFCGSKSEAEDVVQEVFLQAWRSWDKFEGRSAPGTWLYTIAGNLAKTELRRRKRWHWIPIGPSPDDEERTSFFEPVDRGLDLSTNASQEERRAQQDGGP